MKQSKSAEDAAEAANALWDKDGVQSRCEASAFKAGFLAGIAFQREREAELEIQSSCLEKALIVRDEREALLVESLEKIDNTSDCKFALEIVDEARAALLKHLGS
jgi:hypothetical protein